MGARQSKRSVDITTTPKKEAISTEKVKDASPHGSLEKIEERDVAPASNGSVLQDESDKDKDTQNAEKSTEKADSDETSPVAPAEGATDAATSDEKAKRKDKKKKWSFRSISFTRRDKSKPVREASKNGEVAKEALTEGGEESQSVPVSDEPKTDLAETPASLETPTPAEPAKPAEEKPADLAKPTTEEQQEMKCPPESTEEKSVPEKSEAPALPVNPAPEESETKEELRTEEPETKEPEEKKSEEKKPETEEPEITQEKVGVQRPDTEAEVVQETVETEAVEAEAAKSVPEAEPVQEEEKHEVPPPPETTAPSRVANFATTEMLDETAPVESPLTNGICHPADNETAAQEDIHSENVVPASEESTKTDEVFPPAITEDVTSVTQALDQIEITDKAVAAAVDDEDLAKTCPSNQLIVDSVHQ